MLMSAFKWLAIQWAVAFSIFLSLWGVLALIYDADYAARFLELTVKDLLGPWVWTFGYGLMFFIRENGRGLGLNLNAVLQANATVSDVLAILQNSTSHRSALRLTLPITAVGVLLTLAYRVPHYGLSQILVTLGVISIYYVGAFLLWHFVSVLRAFHVIFMQIECVELRKSFSPLHLDNLITYLSLTTVLGSLGIYFGFRGTLTANFAFQHEVWRHFLVTPLILFLPVTLFYNFYPRHVLRQVVQYKLLRAMTRFPEDNIEEMKSLLLDIQSAAAINAQILPFVDYKSLPSYIVAVAFVLTLLYNHDPTIHSFFHYFLGLD